jgi:hypothetical protein
VTPGSGWWIVAAVLGAWAGVMVGAVIGAALDTTATIPFIIVWAFGWGVYCGSKA